jgi:hypothetical protein
MARYVGCGQTAATTANLTLEFVRDRIQGTAHAVDVTGGHMSRKDPVQRNDAPDRRQPVRNPPRDPKARAEELARRSPETLAELQRLVALERLVAEMS